MRLCLVFFPAGVHQHDENALTACLQIPVNDQLWPGEDPRGWRCVCH